MELQVRTIGEPATQSDGVQRADHTTRNVSLASAGAVLVTLKMIICPLTLILLSFGVGTAWLGDLSALAPYQPIFYALAAAQLGLGYYLVYGKPRRACTKGAASANRVAKVSLWAATVLVTAVIAFSYVAPRLFGIY